MSWFLTTIYQNLTNLVGYDDSSCTARRDIYIQLFPEALLGLLGSLRVFAAIWAFWVFWAF